MTSADENVEMLSRAILNEAQTETEQLKEDAQSKADAIRGRANDQAEKERSTILEDASAEAQRIRSQAVATAQLKARSVELEHRERLLDQVFEKVREQLPGVQSNADYTKLVKRLVCEAVTQLGATKADIHADRTTEKLLTTQILEEISQSTKAQLSIGKTLDQGIGIIVEASEGHLHFDNTLETRLNRLQSRLRSSVFRTLTGELHE